MMVYIKYTILLLHPPVDVVPDGQISVEAGYIPYAEFLELAHPASNEDSTVKKITMNRVYVSIFLLNSSACHFIGLPYDWCSDDKFH